MLNRFLATIRPSHLDGVQGADEPRSKPYIKYGERVAQSATPQSAKSTSGAAGSASRQAGAVGGSEEGMTSIVVVFVLVTLLTLIGIGFTKIMNRSLQSSAASQQASAANYAAQSGINDVLSYLKTQPATAAAKCDDLIKTGGPLEKAAKISSDGSTAYTCVLVDPNPTSLFYQGLAPYKSQIVKITTSAQLSSLLFSWQSTNRQHNQFVPAAGGQTFYDEKTWSDKNYAPPLRLTLYPVPASGDLSNVQSSSKTFFLYPQTSGSNTLAYAAAGDTSAVNCSSKNIGSFAGSADYDCNLVINNLPSAAYFYARFAPYYDQAVVKIKGNDGSSQAVQFKNVQSVIDVTAKSGGATKRLQARVDTSSAGGAVDSNISAGSDNVPEFALGSTNTICKRLIVPPSGLNPVTIDAGSIANCSLSLVPPPKPDVTTGDANPIGQTTATLNGTVNPQGYNVTNCKFNYGTTQSYGSSINCSSLPGAGKANVAVSANITGLAAGTTYHFQLVAANTNGENVGGDKTFPTNSPPPPFPDPVINKWVWNSNDSFIYNVSNSNVCTITPDNGGAATTIAPVLNQDFPVSTGQANVGATIKCWDHNVGPATAHAVAGPPPASVNVRIELPTPFYGNNGYDFTWGTTRSTAENDCRDGLHTFIACTSFRADQGGDPGKIVYCTVGPNGEATYNWWGNRHWSGMGHWINFMQGWSGGSEFTRWSDLSYGGKIDETVTVTCYGLGGKSGSDSKRVHWTTCYDRHEQGRYFTDWSRNGCEDVSPPYVPPVAPPPGGGGGGGVCPPGWSGTWPSCAPPPGPPGGCGLLDHRRIFPNYGFMLLPIFKFAAAIPC